MQCSIGNLVDQVKCRKIDRYDTAVERRQFKHDRKKRERSIKPAAFYVAILNNHEDHECNVQKPRLPWHAVGCDCVICERL